MNDLFEPVPNSYNGKVRCKVCGRTGYDGPEGKPHRWQLSCLAGHPFSCACGRKFSTLTGLHAHRNPRRTKNADGCLKIG